MSLWRKRNGDEEATNETTLFFATDVHGSEVCFRKFVNAADFYGADLLVLGGDLTGKFVVPILDDEKGRFRVVLSGQERVVRAKQLDLVVGQLANQGFYPHRMSAAQAERLRSDPDEVESLFVRLACERLSGWLDWARERLAGSGVRVVTAPGNDDPPEMDGVIRERGGDVVLLREGELVEVAPGHEMLNTGYSNHTPWNTHREYDEEEIRAHIEAMASRLRHPDGAIFNVHVPPYGSQIDTAPALNEDLSVKTAAGQPVMAPAGSVAVREAIEHHQPLVSLHGHIHEAAGSVRIGRTLAINAGSEYADGVLRGALLSVGDGKLRRYQATSG
jgi:Icc-related predicted phosphoesterase